MTNFYGLLGVVAFVVALLLSVVLHEAGHLLTAKRFGMKASQFFAGFGATLWSRRRGETEYGIKAIPLGGFVKIVGYTPLETVDPADEPRAFYRQPAPRRAAVIVAGVVMNLLLAFLLLIGLAAGIGIPSGDDATTVVRHVSPCVSAADVCTPRDPVSPSKKAGLRARDRIVSFGGRPVRDWDELSRAIRDTRPGTPVTVVVDRKGARLTLPATVASLGGSGYFGLEPAARTRRLGPVAAVRFAGRFMGDMTVAIGEIVVDIPHAIPKLFGHERASTKGGQAGSIVGGAEASGQVFSSNDTWRDKLTSFVLLVVSLNLFVGLLNLVPLLPLDGGHLAVVGYERLKALVFRIRGRPDPGPVDMTKLMPLTYVAVTLLVGLGVLLILADVINPLKLPQ
ncbi:site-2 protease family protein [Actinomadura sp. DC4]|uniref:M50 family metallopeptidase n=1 Tax=Actinomadura sp. DC4 TaxID=3055069 RepID=UPI0025B220A4|nr:site-2 protease family protein [Actinomadura sp. DC4]MDN3356559.1 site-2 protease family protein [Actinomadura sp. DC4]